MVNPPKYLICESECLVRREQQALRAWRKQRGRDEDDPWMGIALSGGGIRSATFCLGVLQALANNDHLKHFDYVSSVSGGGYISCSLQWWWWHQRDQNPQQTPSKLGVEGPLGPGKDDFPFGTSQPGPAPTGRGDDYKRARLKRLRDHGNYLAPGGAINYWSALGAVLRAILLNLLVWIPLLGVVFFAVAAVDGAIAPYWAQLPVVDRLITTVVPATTPVLYKFALLVVAFSIAFFLLACTFYSFQTIFSEEGKSIKYHITRILIFFAAAAATFYYAREAYHLKKDAFPEWAILNVELNTYLPPMLFVGFLFAVAMLWKATGLSWLARHVFKFPKGVGEAYAYRHMIDYSFGVAFPWFLLFFAFGLIPIASEFVSTYAPKANFSGFLLGLGAVGIGGATSLWGFYQLFRNYAPQLATRFFLPLGGVVFLFGIAVLGFYFGAHMSFENGVGAIEGIMFEPAIPRDRDIQLIVLLIVGISWVSAIFVNINQISINRYYRDRLMEAYMPGKDIMHPDKWGTSQADSLFLENLWPTSDSKGAASSSNWCPPGPYPLINTNVVLINDENPVFCLRGGDNFVLSPHFCGSKATGWSKTKDALPQISLPTAMAASAAAVNPFTGYAGAGPTRGRLVSVVLALLNLRLGFWVRNPVRRVLRRPNHIFPALWYTLTRRGHRRNNYFLELTDGGHFDNLGLYELVRRKCKVILVCDGEMDKQTSYAALVSVQRRIKDDFDAHIIFEPEGPELLAESTKMDYPSDALMAKQTYFVASVVYADGSRGRIIYIKARMIQELSFEVKAYKGAHPDFPHESTGDQFFDPEQFDAHCELGYRACTCANSSIGAVLKAHAGIVRANRLESGRGHP